MNHQPNQHLPRYTIVEGELVEMHAINGEVFCASLPTIRELLEDETEALN